MRVDIAATTDHKSLLSVDEQDASIDKQAAWLAAEPVAAHKPADQRADDSVILVRRLVRKLD